jgi:CheY-like chemotaxis protein
MQAVSAESLPPTSEPSARPGVLVVDDNHLVRAMVQLGLERNGFEVWVAAGGHEAIALYREQKEHIAVVLLDVQMPGLDGPETLDGLRQLNSDIIACFMSGYTGPYETEDLIRRGAARVIAKPFLVSDLANSLRVVAHLAPRT